MRGKLVWLALFVSCALVGMTTNVRYMQEFKHYVEQQERIVFVPHIDAIRELPLDSRVVARDVLLGYDALLADLLWVRAIHYTGGNYTTLCRPIELPDGGVAYKRDDFVNLIETIKFLNPDFVEVYRFAAFVYQEFLRACFEGAVLYDNFDMATDELIEGAARAHEDDERSWRFLYEASFIQFYYKKNYDYAVELCEQAVQAGAEGFVERLCQHILGQSGERCLALMWFQERFEQAQRRGDQIEASILRGHLGRVATELDRIYYEEAMNRYTTARGAAPDNVIQLVQYGRTHQLEQECPDQHLTGRVDLRGNAFYVVVDMPEALAESYSTQPGPQVISTYDHFNNISPRLRRLSELCHEFHSSTGEPPRDWDDLRQIDPSLTDPYDPMNLGQYELLGGMPNFRYTTPQLTQDEQEIAVNPRVD